MNNRSGISLNAVSAFRDAATGHRLLAVTLLGIVVIALMFTIFVGEQAKERERTIAIEGVSQLVSGRINQQVYLWSRLPEAIADYFNISGNPSSSELLEYEQSLQEKFPALQFIFLVDEISESERQNHVRNMKSGGLVDYEIENLGIDGQLHRASSRNEYYPANVFGVEGLDLGSYPQIADAITQLKSGESTVVKMVNFGTELENTDRLVSIQALFSDPDQLEQERQGQVTIAQVPNRFLISGFDLEIMGRNAFMGFENYVAINLLVNPGNDLAAGYTSVFKSGELDPAEQEISRSNLSTPIGTWLVLIKPFPDFLSDWSSTLQFAIPLLVAVATALFGAVTLVLVQQRKDADGNSQRLARLKDINDQFLSTVTHELKTPLTSIKAFSEILTKNRNQNLDEKELKYLTIISRNTEHLNVLIDDLLGASRLRAGTFELDIQEFVIRDLVTDVCDGLEVILSENNQTLEIRMDLQTQCISADRLRIEQALSNLITNASKYSDTGSTIFVSASVNKSQLKMNVRDQGIGISASDLERIGTPFFRAESQESRSVGGTGLGMYITKSIVELHGGELKVSSELGRGTEVDICLRYGGVTMANEEESASMSSHSPASGLLKAAGRMSSEVVNRGNN